jgi:WS/DGAT/MGAT family acyltransferase
VLLPISTDGWRVDQLDEHVERVRNGYLETLGETVPTSTPDAGAPPPSPASPGAVPLAAPRGWGTSPGMNPLETVMWRAEAGDRRLSSNVALVEILDREPDWSRLRAAHERALAAIPRMRQRVAEPPFGIGPPRWVAVDGVDLDRHLRRRALEPPGDDRQLLDLAAQWAHAPLDRDRPLWEAMLVTGLSGGRAAYLVKTHHSVTDGLGAVQLLARLHSRTAEPTVSTQADGGPAAPEELPRGSTVQRGDSQLRSALGGLLHPQALARRVLDTGLAAVRAAVPAGSASPLLSARSGEWHFDLIEVDLARLKAAAKAAGGSVNDGFIAALLGGFRRYHERSGAPVETMPVAIPVSLRSEDDPLGGNRFTGIRFTAPVGDPDPASRIEAVRGFVLTARRSAALDVVPLLAPALALLPGPVMARTSGAITAATDLQASSFPGIPYPVYIAGARITHMFPFGPLPGCAAMITMISHDGTCCVGVNIDPAAVTDPALLMECLAEGFDEVLALAAESGRS